ncbi:MAG: hypothetical protein E7590_07460 [Ruminococcaceae bacterium]|nr:hypothetical protein [Oscillospiraceae bacterium]MBE6701906.1 hypothetical protein [Oscillospiraceae bacterium]
MTEHFEGMTIEEINAAVLRKIKIRKRLEALSQDFMQVVAGEIIPDLDERKAEFVALHNELRVLEGKEPRLVAAEGENV